MGNVSWTHIDVEWKGQENLYKCGPACVQMIAAKYGVKCSQDEIRNAIDYPTDRFRPKECRNDIARGPYRVAAALNHYLHLDVPVWSVESSATIADAMQSIYDSIRKGPPESGYPVVAATYGTGHWVTVIGLGSEANGTKWIRYNDPADRRFDTLESYWRGKVFTKWYKAGFSLNEQYVAVIRN